MKNYKELYLTRNIKSGFLKMSDNDYFSIDLISNSFLKKFDKSPEHALTKIGETAALKKGKLFHSFLLENEFEENYMIANCSDRKCAEYKEIKKNTNKEIILEKELSELVEIKERLNNFTINEITFARFLKQSEKEIAIIWKDESNNIFCKAKLDIYIDQDIPIIIDLKSTLDASSLKGGFEKSISNYQYARQAAFYNSGIFSLTGKTAIFIFIAIEKSPPYGISSYILNEEYLAWGWGENQKSIEAFQKWEGQLKNYSHEINYVKMPYWQK